MNLLTQRFKVGKELRVYLTKNKTTIEREYNIQIPKTIVNMSGYKFSAWLQVHANRIFLAKDVKECVELKDMVKKFILIDREIEISENTL